MLKQILTYCTDNYKTLISDYHHLLIYHLDIDKEQSRKNYRIMHDEICKYVKCDIHDCDKYMRNRIRREEKD